MKILYINGKFLNQPETGVQRFAKNIILNLDLVCIETNPKFRIVLLKPYGSADLNLKYIEQINTPKISNTFWEQLLLPFYCRFSHLLNLSGSAPLINSFRNIVTIHDAAIHLYPEAYSFIFRFWYKILYKINSFLKINIITVSYSSANQLANFYKKNTFTVIYNSAEHFSISLSDDTSIIYKFFLSEVKYFIAVSSLNKTKNLKSLIEAFNKFSLKNIGYKLIIVGSSNSAVFAGLSIVEADDIVFSGRVTDSDLCILLKNAEAFIFPSYYEGFGIPPLEAMTIGCPVLASNTSSIPEICGDAAYYFDPFDINDISLKMEEFILNPALRLQLIEKGYLRSKFFSWKISASELYKLLEIEMK